MNSAFAGRNPAEAWIDQTQRELQSKCSLHSSVLGPCVSAVLGSPNSCVYYLFIKAALLSSARSGITKTALCRHAHGPLAVACVLTFDFMLVERRSRKPRVCQFTTEVIPGAGFTCHRVRGITRLEDEMCLVIILLISATKVLCHSGPGTLS